MHFFLEMQRLTRLAHFRYYFIRTSNRLSQAFSVFFLGGDVSNAHFWFCRFSYGNSARPLISTCLVIANKCVSFDNYTLFAHSGCYKFSCCRGTRQRVLRYERKLQIAKYSSKCATSLERLKRQV